MITSTGNQKVKRLVNLMKKRKARDEEGLFLTEGIRMFREIPAGRLKEVYVSESFYEKEKDVIGRVLEKSGAHLETVSDAVYGYVSDTKTPQGVLCVVGQMEYTLDQAAGGECPLVLVLDNLQDPGNMGTVIRTAEAAGVTGIIMSSGCVDVYNPKTIRSTMGSVCRMPFLKVDDLKEAIGWMKKRGVHTYAAHLEGSLSYDTVDYTKPCAFFIGNEGNGLRDEIAGLADTYIHIPMGGQVESLNAAVASSVIMFEAARQRRRHRKG